MAKQLLVHVCFAQEGDHEDLLLCQAQTRTAVNVPVQMPPVQHSDTMLILLSSKRFNEGGQQLYSQMHVLRLLHT